MTKPLTAPQLRCLELSAIIREGLEGVRLFMARWRIFDSAGCATAGCIAGHACAVYDKPTWDHGTGGKIFMSACDLLGLSTEQATELFQPWEIGGPAVYDITPAMAAAALESVGLTGKVVWPK